MDLSHLTSWEHGNPWMQDVVCRKGGVENSNKKTENSAEVGPAPRTERQPAKKAGPTERKTPDASKTNVLTGKGGGIVKNEKMGRIWGQEK